MAVDGDDRKPDGSYVAFNAPGKPRVPVEGWVLQHVRGSDGEPLMVGARPRRSGVTKSEPDSPLLTHHDPRERALAVLAHRLTPRQLHRAARDPHPDVRAAALGHPDLTPAMLHLLCHSRHLADGRPVGRAVVDFLTHPHATKEHAKAVLGAAKNDPSPEAREAESIANEVGARWGS